MSPADEKALQAWRLRNLYCDRLKIRLKEDRKHRRRVREALQWWADNTPERVGVAA